MPEVGDEHPGELELRHYVHGSLQRGHAAAVLAHAVACRACAARLLASLPDPAPRRLPHADPARPPASV